MDQAPSIWWIRRDFRLSENPALVAALADGGPVIPVFIHDPMVEALPAAPKWRMGLGLEVLAQSLDPKASRLILRRGPALQVLRDLVAETGASAVHWNRLYDPGSIARDTAVKAGLQELGRSATSHHAHVLFEPWTVETGQGGYYRVYSPFWRAVHGRQVAAPEPAPARIPAPDQWPASEQLDVWQMGRAMDRGAAIVRPHLLLGERAATERLQEFSKFRLEAYKQDRDLLDRDACSGLSEPLTYGEIGPRTIWHAGQAAMHHGARGAEHFLKELVWRDFAHHLIYHSPEITRRNWRADWDDFPWDDTEDAAVLAWKQGRTGVEVIDAAMRELYVTGRMHNRARMLVASYLTKHMMKHWRIGMDWFAECLVDWDPASNAMGWQWVAGSGPDAAPYFRVFNPDTQAEKFDAKGRYRRKWLAELPGPPHQTAQSFFAAVPRSWGLSPDQAYPAEPIVGLKAGRDRALAAYAARKT